MPWEPLDFDGRRVVEIGCGPLGGYGPLAIFCGAAALRERRAGMGRDAVLKAPGVARTISFHLPRRPRRALRPAHGFRRVPQSVLRERMQIQRCGLREVAPSAGTADIVMSQSCLEHVFPIEGTIDKLAEIQYAADALPASRRFRQSLSDRQSVRRALRAAARRLHRAPRQGDELLRAPDIDALFKSRNIPARVVPSRNVKDTYRGTIHPWWRERYDDAALFTQLALVAGPRHDPVMHVISGLEHRRRRGDAGAALQAR